MLPSPSPEQEVALTTWKNGNSQVVTACAGSGKSTLLLHAAFATTDECLIIAYNRPLADDMTDALRRHKLNHVKCMTFHGLASFVYELAPDDVTLENILDRVDAGELQPRQHLKPARVCIDEAQDIRPLHIRLVKTALQLKGTTMIICGDARQLLYDYETPPATVEYMQHPEVHFQEGKWHRNELSVSYRLTPCNASFANLLLENEFNSLIGGNAKSPNQVPLVMTCTNWDWAALIPKMIRQLETEPERVTILVRSTKATNTPLLALVNALTRCGLPVYVHGVDGGSQRIKEGKIRVCTWHASKGTESDVVFVLGVSGDSDLRPLHVAVTRPRMQLIVVQDLRSPRNSIIDTVREGLAKAVDQATRELVRSPPQPPARPFTPQRPFDLTEWSPRCLWDEMSQCVVELGRSGADDPLPSEIVVNVQGLCEDVTKVYVRGALLYLDARRGYVPNKVREMLHPTRVERNERVKRLKNGDRVRYVDPRQRDSELQTEAAKSALQAVADATEDVDTERAIRWVGAAVAEGSFAGFQHAASRLLPATWASNEIFDNIVERLLPAFCNMNKWQTDVVATNGMQVSRIEVVADSEVAWTVIYADRIPTSARLRACVPLAIDSSLRMAGIVNAQTGERALFSLTDREKFLLLLV